MDKRPRLLTLLLPILLIAGCSEPAKQTQTAAEAAAQVAADTVADATEQAEDLREAAAPDTTAVVLALRESFEAITPEPLPPAAPAGRRQLDPLATALITRWEVGSPAQYVKKYQRPICPGGASGPTIGIGYDLGHQTAATIRSDWAKHPQVDRLATGSGKVGPGACAAWRAENRDIVVPLDAAQAVFEDSTLPAYTAAAERALGKKVWAGLPYRYQAGMKSLGYNRGWRMVGDRNTEKREIRDNCAPPADAECGARALVAMCRLWVGTPNYTGLCNRRKDEARTLRGG